MGAGGTEWGRRPPGRRCTDLSHQTPPNYPSRAAPPPPALVQFEEIHEVIARYKTLVSMHHDLMQSAQEGQEKIERAKARLARYKEEKDDEILQHNNELARLQMRFDRARSDVIIWVSAGRAGATQTHTDTGSCGRDTHTHTSALTGKGHTHQHTHPSALTGKGHTPGHTHKHG